jgi:3'-phosphoadenosine 5'-phosphosulfate (PAPS) 3'-phosphatase
VKAPPVRIDSQAKYGALSRGDGAIYLRFPHKGYREKIWDHAAGSIVVTGAFLLFMSFWLQMISFHPIFQPVCSRNWPICS